MLARFRFLVVIVTIATMLSPLFAQDVPYGEAFTIAETYWLQQQTTSVGKMVARDTQGGTHFTWTGMTSAQGARHAWFSFTQDGAGEIGEQLADMAAIADVENRAGYTAIDLITIADEQHALVFHHGSSKAIAGFDFGRGFGSFSPIYGDPPGDVIPITIKGCGGRSGRVFFGGGVHNPMAGDPNFILTLWPADPVDGGDSWNVGARAIVDTLTGVSYALAASRTTNACAVGWHYNLIGVPAPQQWAGRLEHQMNADIRVGIAADGQRWNWDNLVNVTKTIEPDPELEGLAQLGDTLRPFADMDMIYVGEVLHVVFTAKGWVADTTDELVPPVDRVTLDESMIWHWDSASDTLTLVANGWYPNENSGQGFDGNVARPSLGADVDGNLYCIWREVDLDDVAPLSYCYGDVMLSIRLAGEEWSEPINLTDSHPVDDNETEYVDEQFPSIAELVDENLHLSYSLAAETSNQGATEPSKIVYQRIALADLPDVNALEMPRENFQYHNSGALDVAGNGTTTPLSFSLDPVYPNPFNGSASICYRVNLTQEIKLTVTDISGRKVSTLVNGKVETGAYQVTWDASAFPSGVYWLKLKGVEGVANQRVILMK
jgi:hypothetical protein